MYICLSANLPVTLDLYMKCTRFTFYIWIAHFFCTTLSDDINHWLCVDDHATEDDAIVFHKHILFFVIIIAIYVCFFYILDTALFIIRAGFHVILNLKEKWDEFYETKFY